MIRCVASIAVLFCAALSGCGGKPTAVAEGDDCPTCRAELRSWVVFGRGRHLLLRIDCPEPIEHLDGVVEFTKISLRRDFVAPVEAVTQGENVVGGEWAEVLARTGPARLGRMSRGPQLRPALGSGAERLEAVYEIDCAQAESLQRDRVWDATYELLGPNSNSGLASVMREAGLTLPAHVARGGGALGSFPGVTLDPGEDLPAHEWAIAGLPGGPTEPEPELAHDVR